MDNYVRVVAHCACGNEIVIIDTRTWRVHDIRLCQACAPIVKQEREHLAYLQGLENKALGLGHLSENGKTALHGVQAKIAKLLEKFKARDERRPRQPDVTVVVDGKQFDLVDDLGNARLDEFEPIPPVKCGECEGVIDVDEDGCFCVECYNKRIDKDEHEELEKKLAAAEERVGQLENELADAKKDRA